MAHRIGKKFLWEEVDTAIREYQPLLGMEMSNSGIRVAGPFKARVNSEKPTLFEVKLEVKPDYRFKEPTVYEVGGRIPRKPNRHINPNNTCCLGAPWLWSLYETTNTFEKFLNGRMGSFFFSQAYFNEYESWPFGELPHGDEGIILSISSALKVPNRLVDIRCALAALIKPGGRSWLNAVEKYPDLREVRKTIGPTRAKKIQLELSKLALQL